MRKYFGFKEEDLARFFRVKKVWAEEPTPPATPPIDPPAEPPKKEINYEDLISKARKEEKDKLYPQIDSLKKEVATLTEKGNAHLLTIGSKDAEIESLKSEIEKVKADKGKTDSEEVASLKAEIKALKKELEEEKKNRINPEEIESKIKAEYEVKLYREVKLREVGEACIPELVFGDTKEEIDASLLKSQERYTQIIGKVTSTNVNNIPVPNPSNLNDKGIDFDAVMNADMNDWKEMRKKLGLK